MQNKKSNENILEIKNLNKVFSQKGSLVVAVDNANFEIKQGETIGLIGESGSGKTTIGRTIIRLHKPTSGQILLNNVDVAAKRLSKDENKLLRESIQMIFQDPYSSLNEQKNIMNIVSEPIQILKLGDKYISDLYENIQKVYKFFGITLSDEYYKRIYDFRVRANKIANKAYSKILSNLDTIKFTRKTKKADAELLFSQYYGLKEQANMKIINEMLSVPSKLFDAWSTAQKNIKDDNFDSKIEKDVFDKMVEYEKALDLSKYSANYIKVRNRYVEMTKIKDKYDTFYNDSIRASEKNIKNALSQWKNNTKIKFNLLKRADTFSEYNFIYIDYLLSKEIQKVVVNINKTSKLVGETLIDELNELYLFTKNKLKYKFNEVKLVNNRKVKLNISLLMQEHPAILENFSTILNKNTKSIDEAFEVIFDIYRKSEKTGKFKDYSKLIDEISNIKSEMKILSKEPVDEDTKRKLEIAEKEFNIAKEKDDIDYKEYITEHEMAIAKIEEERSDKLDILNSDLKNNREDAKKNFDQRLSELLKSDKPSFNADISRQSDFAFRKWLKKQINVNESTNNNLDSEINRIYKDLDVIKRFITNNKPSKRKMRKMLIRNRVYKALEDSGLTKAHAYRYPHEFSGGMRQRVGIARAIIAEPKIIIADEPIAALDLSIQAQIVNMLKSLQKRDNMSMIFIAHDLSMVKYISDKLLIIHLGKIIEFGSSDEIFNNPIHPYTKNLIASMPDIAHISKGFKNNNFEPTYLNAYSPTNEPIYHKISPTHEVLADSRQIKKWK